MTESALPQGQAAMGVPPATVQPVPTIWGYGIVVLPDGAQGVTIQIASANGLAVYLMSASNAKEVGEGIITTAEQALVPQVLVPQSRLILPPGVSPNGTGGQ